MERSGSTSERHVVFVIGDDMRRNCIIAALDGCGYDIRKATDFKPCSNIFLGARNWVSANSLRRLEGRKIKVICCGKPIDVIKIVFQDHINCVTFVTEKPTLMSRIGDMLYKEQLFTCRGATYVVEGEGREFELRLRHSVNMTPPFEICSQIIYDTNSRMEAWRTEKVILFGMTGSGKSTLAQMLTCSSLSTETEFIAGSGPRGVTGDITQGKGRGWHVVDTPGFGEGHEGTMDTEKVGCMLNEFVRCVRGRYSHFIYVIKKNRITQCDTVLWRFFTKVFSGASKNFTIVVTNCTKDSFSNDQDYLRRTFEGCNSFTYVNFRPLSNDQELEEENIKKRTRSLESLEKHLIGLHLSDVSCWQGMFSTEAIKALIDEHSALLLPSLRFHAWLYKSVIPASMLSTAAVRIVSQISKPPHIDESFMLSSQ